MSAGFLKITRFSVVLETFLVLLLTRYNITFVFSPNAGKYGPEKTPYLDTFHAVLLFCKILIFWLAKNWIYDEEDFFQYFSEILTTVSSKSYCWWLLYGVI